MCRLTLGLSMVFCSLFTTSIDAQFRSFGGGGFGSDPNQIFDFLAKGRPHFLISETRSLREPLTQYAKEKGITNDQITRDQFTAFMRNHSQGSANASPSPQSQDQFTQIADVEFKRRDRNGDGKLNLDELNDSLRSNMDTYDKNKDGVIDFNEYKTYYFARMTQQGPFAPNAPKPQQPQQQQQPPQETKGGPPRNPVVILIEDDLDVRPTMHRAGKLPSDLPKWFAELDGDSDGQIALYEWRKGGKNLDEFRDWDRNDDGFITPDECLRRQALGPATTSPGSPTATSPVMSRGPSFGGPGGPRPFGGGFGGKDFFKGRK